jgi:DUF971 family protein
MMAPASSCPANICGCSRLRPKCAATARPRRMLVTGKEQVNITAIEPVGNYAVKLVFDDGHSTGLYSWMSCMIWA